ncbi:hypothetical protein PROPEN_02052 [Proteus penneri ATCC 35198]|nr:hypothetical protein PROPEN_02052 [Proteus penneri ATCC 35198]
MCFYKEELLYNSVVFLLYLTVTKWPINAVCDAPFIIGQT